MRVAYGAIRDLGGEVVAIAAEATAAARDQVTSLDLPYVVLGDPDLATIDRYGVRHVDEPKGRSIARPSVFVLGRDGVVRFLHVGEHERDRPAIAALLLALETLT